MSGVHVVPQPVTLEHGDGPPFVVSASTRVCVDDDPATIAAGVVVADTLAVLSGQGIGVVHGEDRGAGVVQLRIVTPGDATPVEGAYRLSVTQRRVEVLASTRSGLLHALATIRQIIRTGVAGTAEIPAVQVRDAPRYPWRGLSVDVARHFFGPAELRRLVDLCALYKLNVLHVHLTDDQGWRLEIPSRRRLTELSSGTGVGGGPGGFLTVGEWTALAAHADARGVTLVPEIDLPGHVNAALHAYPELNPGGRAPDVYTGIEVGFSRLHADLPATARFVADVLADVAALTPGPFVHLGGDEVLQMERAEYDRLVVLAADVLRQNGKEVVGWQEVARTPLGPGAVLQVWDTREDLAHLKDAVDAGARVLLSPGSRTYLDMKYTPEHPLGLDWAGHVEVRDAYDWDPATLLPGLDPEAVVGVEAAVWTETLRTFGELSSMLLPRLPAVAEVAWSQPWVRDWDDFRRRLAQHPRLWRRHGLAYHPSPQVDWPR